MKKKLLIACDSPNSFSGFSTVTRNLFEPLSKEYDLYGFFVNYNPLIPIDNTIWTHHTQAKFESASPYNPQLLATYAGFVKPDKILMNNDFWVVAEWLNSLEGDGNYYLYFPVDSAMPVYEPFKKLIEPHKIIAYTEFQNKVLGRDDPVISHGIDGKVWNKAVRINNYRKMFNLPEDKKIILLAGAHSHRKNHFTALKAIRALQLERPGEFLALVHTRPVTTSFGPVSLYELARLAGFDITNADELLFSTTPLSQEFLPKLFSCADLYLSVSLGEGWGLMSPEIASLGVPCLLPDNTCVKEIMGDAAEYIDVDSENLVAFPIDYNVRINIRWEDVLKSLRGFKPKINKAGYLLADKYRWNDQVDKFLKVLDG